MMSSTVAFQGSFESVQNLDNFSLKSGAKAGLKWDWKVTSGLAFNYSTRKLENAVFLSWKFDWAELKKTNNVGGFEGTITANWTSRHWNFDQFNYQQKKQNCKNCKFEVQLSRCGEWIQKKITGGESHFCQNTGDAKNIAFDFELKAVHKTREMLVFESICKKSDLNDVTLIVEGSKKIHVNKALLSYHSEYFRALFSSNFQEKSMKEIPIDDVKHEDFVVLLCLLTNPISPTVNNIAKTLELSDRFMMQYVPKMADLMIRKMEDVKFETLLMLASTYKLEETEKECMEMITLVEHIKIIGKMNDFEKLTDKTKIQLLTRCLSLL